MEVTQYSIKDYINTIIYNEMSKDNQIGNQIEYFILIL